MDGLSAGIACAQVPTARAWPLALVRLSLTVPSGYVSAVAVKPCASMLARMGSVPGLLGQAHHAPQRAQGRGSDRHAERPSVITAIVTSDRGVLIGHRHDGKPPWTFIAGEQEPGESPADTIIREVKEETGLEITAGEVLGERAHPATKQHMVYLAVRPATDSLAVTVGDPDELSEVRQAGLAEAVELLPGMFEPVREHLDQSIS